MADKEKPAKAAAGGSPKAEKGAQGAQAAKGGKSDKQGRDKKGAAPKTAAAPADLPQQTHVRGSVGCSPSGRHRIVAELSSLTRASHSALPHHGAAVPTRRVARAVNGNGL